MLGKAISIAAKVFENTKDKGGQPYILHCIRVMNNPRINTLAKKIVAILHDVPEDSDITIEDLRKQGFSEEILTALALLDFKRSGLSYQDTIKKLSFNEIATDVKLSDLEDNSNITRIKGLSKKDFDRLEKYHIAYTYLSNK